PQTDNSELTFEMIGEMELLPFLLEALQSKGRNSVKSILSRGQVSINNIVSTQHNEVLTPGDVVSILKKQPAKRKDRLIGLKIMYEDNKVIVNTTSTDFLLFSINN